MGKKMAADTNALNWFEISVSNLDRAKKFYESIFEIMMMEETVAGNTIIMFPAGMEGGVGGALAKSEHHIPSDKGALIYLNANPTIAVILDRVEKAGGKIITQKTAIGEHGEHGFIAFIKDTEGNVIGLHSNG